MSIKWNADGYTDNFKFVHKYGEELLELITAPSGSLVLDLGCGNGALTEALCARGYRAFGIDADSEMVKKAKALHPQIKFFQGDACGFHLDEKADVIFSNAVFHWIDDHKALVKNIARNLKSGGELVFEFGGKGNVSAIHSALTKAFKERGLKYSHNSNTGSIGAFGALLEKNGFTVKYASLFERPTELAGESGLADWINMFRGGAFMGIDAKTKGEIIARVEELCRPVLYRNGKWYADYVRLRMKAIKNQSLEDKYEKV